LLSLSTFVATQHFVSNRSNSGRAADIEPMLMTHIRHPTTKLAVVHSSDVTDRISGVVNGIDAGSD
jgi:hypothetical protein